AGAGAQPGPGSVRGGAPVPGAPPGRPRPRPRPRPRRRRPDGRAPSAPVGSGESDIALHDIEPVTPERKRARSHHGQGPRIRCGCGAPGCLDPKIADAYLAASISTAWATPARVAATLTDSQICSLVRPALRTTSSCAATQSWQPLIVDTASDHSSKSTLSTPGLPMMFIRRPMRTWV